MPATELGSEPAQQESTPKRDAETVEFWEGVRRDAQELGVEEERYLQAVRRSIELAAADPHLSQKPHFERIVARHHRQVVQEIMALDL